MFLKSSELERIGDKNYLRIFLDEKYPYKIKYNGDDVEILDFVFEEPSMQDITDLKKLGISIEKLISYQDVKTIRIASMFSRGLLDEARLSREEDEFDKIEEEELSDEKIEAKEKDRVKNCREFLANLLLKSNDFEDESSDFFLEMDKFFAFIDKKCGREHSNAIVHKASLSVLDKYHAISCFIKEEILIEYLSFFFIHFPSKSLHINANLI